MSPATDQRFGYFSATYTFDAAGRRVAKSAGGAVTAYIYFGTQAIAERSSGAWTDYILAGGRVIASAPGTASSTGTKYFHADHLGSTRLLSDTTGAPITGANYDYKPFGELTTSSPPPAPGTFLFTGLERDAATGEAGLDHTWFRKYSPTQGRWCTPDPLGGDIANPQSLNRYVYVQNDPLNLVDRLGLCGISPLTGQNGTDGVTVTSPFGSRIHPRAGQLQFHNGADIRAASGSNLYAMLPGTIVRTGEGNRSGVYVTVQATGTNYFYQYLHLNQTQVSPPYVVHSVWNEPLALSGATGSATAPHLHLSVYRMENGRRVDLDPIAFLRRRICPWDMGQKSTPPILPSPIGIDPMSPPEIGGLPGGAPRLVMGGEWACFSSGRCFYVPYCAVGTRPGQAPNGPICAQSEY